MLVEFVGMGFKGVRFVECIHVAVFAIFPTSLSNRSSISQSTNKQLDAREERIIVIVLSFEAACTLIKKQSKQVQEKSSNFMVNRDNSYEK